MANRVFADSKRIIPITILAEQTESEIIACNAPVTSEFAQNVAGDMQVQSLDTPAAWVGCVLTLNAYYSLVDPEAKPIRLCDGTDSAVLTIPTVDGLARYKLVPYWLYDADFFSISCSIAPVADITLNVIMQPINQVPA